MKFSIILLLCSFGYSLHAQKNLHVKKTTTKRVDSQSMVAQMISIDSLDQNGNVLSWTTSGLEGRNRDYRWYVLDEKGNWTRYVKSGPRELGRREFTYADNDSILKVVESGSFKKTKTYTYDENWKIQEERINHRFYGVEETVVYTYNKDGQLISAIGKYTNDKGENKSGSHWKYTYKNGKLLTYEYRRPHFKNDDYDLLKRAFQYGSNGEIAHETASATIYMSGMDPFVMESEIKYLYNKNGELIKTEHYKKGVFDHIKEFSYVYYE